MEKNGSKLPWSSGNTIPARLYYHAPTFLKQKILEEPLEWKPTEGTPQDAVISPLPANLYLHPLDTLMRKAGYEITRYADDFVIPCPTAEDARRALEMVQRWLISESVNC